MSRVTTSQEFSVHKWPRLLKIRIWFILHGKMGGRILTFFLHLQSYAQTLSTSTLLRYKSLILMTHYKGIVLPCVEFWQSNKYFNFEVKIDYWKEGAKNDFKDLHANMMIWLTIKYLIHTWRFIKLTLVLNFLEPRNSEILKTTSLSCVKKQTPSYHVNSLSHLWLVPI